MGAAALFAIVLCANVAHAGDQDFTLVNKTGVTIHNLHVSPHDENSWGEDVLGKDTLDDGEEVEVKFSRSEAAEDWDLQVKDKDGNSISWANLRLTKISKIIIHLEDGKATATLE
jgi:hypothetical protein